MCGCCRVRAKTARKLLGSPKGTTTWKRIYHRNREREIGNAVERDGYLKRTTEACTSLVLNTRACSCHTNHVPGIRLGTWVGAGSCSYWNWSRPEGSSEGEVRTRRRDYHRPGEAWVGGGSPWGSLHLGAASVGGRGAGSSRPEASWAGARKYCWNHGKPAHYYYKT
jgi:hypothetical protein